MDSETIDFYQSMMDTVPAMYKKVDREVDAEMSTAPPLTKAQKRRQKEMAKKAKSNAQLSMVDLKEKAQ